MQHRMAGKKQKFTTQTIAKVLRRHEVEHFTGLSRSTIYAMINEGSFPRPIHLSSRSVGWLENEVDDWLQKRISKRRKKILISEFSS